MEAPSILYRVTISTWRKGIRAFRSDLRATGKPREVEGVLDTYLIRPSGLLVTWLVRSTSVSPAALTAAAVVAGWLAAYFFFLAAKSGNQGNFGWLAAVTLLVHSAFDSADGQLARWKNEASDLGRLIDGIGDYLSFLAIYLAIGFGLDIAHQSNGPVFVAVSLFAGASHALQCALVEYQRNLYRQIALGTEMGAALSAKDEAKARAESASGFAWLLHVLHIAYTRIQTFFCGSSMLLSDRIHHWKQAHPEHQHRLRRVVVSNQGKILRSWAVLAPNSHKVAVIVGAILPVDSGSTWGSFGLVWYFIYVLGFLNILLIVFLKIQRSADRKTWRDIQSLNAPRSSSHAT